MHIDEKSAYDEAKNKARSLIMQARIESIKNELENSKKPQMLCKKLNSLLHCQKRQHSNDDDCAAIVPSFNSFFLEKVEIAHNNIESRLNNYKLTSVNNSFRSNSNSIISCFDAITPSDVVKIMKKSWKRTSPLDPFPHQVSNHCTKPLSKAIAKLINVSFQEGHFSSIYKTAQITPLLKKPNLDPTVPEHFRTISNFSTISKIVERAILIQLRSHITNNHNFPSFQSVYRSNHSTETALLHVLDEVYIGCDSKKASILTLLDLSAAFDTIDHRILLERLSREFGIESLALKWLESYLTERKQFVKLGTHSSSTVTIEHGVPQGSVLGPLLFTTCISPISSIFNNFNLTHHQYADEIQILIKINPHFHSH